MVLALKKSEIGDEIVIRLVELNGKPIESVKVKFAGSLESAREVNGQELPLSDAKVAEGALETSFKPYQPRHLRLEVRCLHRPRLRRHLAARHPQLRPGSRQQ